MKQGSVITIDIGASKIRFAVINTKKEITEYLDVPSVSLAGLDIDNKKLIEILIDGIKKYSSALAKEEDFPLAISIGTAGKVDSENGIIEVMPNLKGVENLNIVEELRHEFSLPVFLLNDADAGALGEWWLGEGKGFANIIYATIGTGVGTGIIMRGELQPGSELGHETLAIENEERACGCGERNCAEAFLGTNGLAEIYAEVFGVKPPEMSKEEKQSLSPKMRLGVSSGDKKWLAVQDKYSGYLAVFLEKIVSDRQPQAIILGGGIAFGNNPLLEAVIKKLPDFGEVKILLAQFENSVNLGAAKYAFDKLGE